MKKTPLFNGINDDELLTMLNCIQPRIVSYKKNDYIALAGEKFNSIGIIAQGEASISKDNAAGNRVVMAILKAGDMFGEMLVFSKVSACLLMFRHKIPARFFSFKEKKLLENVRKCAPGTGHLYRICLL